jgi:hypothetical protein
LERQVIAEGRDKRRKERKAARDDADNAAKRRSRCVRRDDSLVSKSIQNALRQHARDERHGRADLGIEAAA